MRQPIIILISMGLDEYSSQKIASSSEFQIEQMLNKFKSQEVSYLKLTGFLGFNLAALTGLYHYAKWFVKSRWIKKGEKGKLKKSQLTLVNLFKKGSVLGLQIGGLYMAGFLLVGYYTMSIPVFRKYCELKEALELQSCIYDPYWQEALLFRKMKKFGLSDNVISQVKIQIWNRKQQLISSNRLKPQTVEHIRKAEKLFSQKIEEPNT